MVTRIFILKVLGLVLLAALVTGIAAGSGWAQTTGYRLPWAYCGWQRVLQGWGESPSHNNTQMWYAYDFSHSEGVPVRAAYAGTVKFVQTGRTQCGGSELANQANYVTIEHGDGTAALYLHLRDVYISGGQSVARGQTIGTAGKTGWTNCVPHLHFQRQNPGAWITNSRPVYFDEHPGQQLQRNQWYQSQNYWPGDRCPTQAGTGLGCSGVVGAGIGRRILRWKKSIRTQVGILVIGAMAVGLSGCGKLQAVESLGAATPPGTPAMLLGPDEPVAAVTPSPAPPVVEPPPPPTPGPVPTPRPIVLPSPEEVEKIVQDWKHFRDTKLGLSFRYPPEYEIRIQGDTGWTIISIERPVQDPTWGMLQEAFLSLFVWSEGISEIKSAEGFQAWEATLPAERDPVGGKVVTVQEAPLPGTERAWVIQWEPLPGNPEVIVQSVAWAGAERMVWVNLGDLTYRDRQRELSLWPLQMAFLATLELTQ